MGRQKSKLSKDQFTSRTWKVLAGSRDRDGYTFSGGEARAVAFLMEHELVSDKSVGPTRRVVVATPAGEALHDDYLKLHNQAPMEPIAEAPRSE